MNIYSINTGHFKLDGGAMFGVVPKSMWHKINPADENNMCSWAMRCLLIEDGKVPEAKAGPLMKEANELLAITVSSINTARKSGGRQ